MKRLPARNSRRSKDASTTLAPVGERVGVRGISPAKRLSTPALSRRRKETEISRRPGIEQDTELMPWLIADSVFHEASCYLETVLPVDWSDWLDQRAEGCYRKHKQFRTLVRGRGNRGRDTLYRYFRHWLASRLHREKHRLYRCLPHSYSFGLPLSSR